MSHSLEVLVGQSSDRGIKTTNQDALGLMVPSAGVRLQKGVALVMADGISSSPVSQVASAVSVQSFLSDYYSTPDTWSVGRSAQRVMAALNTWLYAQDRALTTRDRGHVCTLSVLVVRSATAHIFHVGDTRVYRFNASGLECLTDDHRLYTGDGCSYLSRALGMSDHVEIDYRQVPLEVGDQLLIMTDGIYAFLSRAQLIEVIRNASSPEACAARLVACAREAGSDDNLSAQVLQVIALPHPEPDEWIQRLMQLPQPSPWEPGQNVDDFKILRCVHAGSRSRVYVAEVRETALPVVLKVPSAELAQDARALVRLFQEEWIARRIKNPHLVRCSWSGSGRRVCYTVTDYVPGETLRAWMRANPRPGVAEVRGLIVQIARAVQALHRLEIVHRDIRPENILLTPAGQVCLIDLGSARVAGLMADDALMVAEAAPDAALAYAAPEFFLGESGSERSDQYSLGVVAYELLTGRLPYGTRLSGARSRHSQNQVVYQSLLSEDRDIPAWLDGVIRQAVHPLPHRRYEALSEFIYQLHHPSADIQARSQAPWTLHQRLIFWQRTAAALFLVVVFLSVALGFD